MTITERDYWITTAVQACNEAAEQGVSVTITRRVAESGHDETTITVGQWIRRLAEDQ